jgi:type I restriction enzyme, R subunit
MPGETETERKTRKKRIDPKLDAAGWELAKAGSKANAYRTEEEETDNGPADYALWLHREVVGIVEAKKVTLGPQNVLSQAERYARGLRKPAFDFQGLGCPFLYSTNGEVLWFHDVRHALNRSREISGFHTPAALGELLSRDFDAACGKLLSLPHDNARLRDYQHAANEAVEKAIAERKRALLVAMATGTGKTYTLVNQVHRLMKSGVAKRVLFLVDRRALAAQAVRSFSAFEAEPGKKFDQIYEVYSSKFQKEDFGEDEKFDPKLLPQKYLTDPKPSHSFVYVATIQRMAMNILGRQAIFGAGDEAIDEDADKLDIPIHAFDVIVADECHRGYTSQELSVWRSTLDHFDAIKIGLTATPAKHTTAYFTHKVYEYPYERAVEEGYLVDYDVVNVRSEVRMKGVFLKEGENVKVVDTKTGLTNLDKLEDERTFDASQIEAKVTAPESNKKILEEVKRYADLHEAKCNRFPKTLIFAVNDLPHTSHANQLVDLARDLFEKGDAFVSKITGAKDVDRPLQRIREFRNRPNPGIAVTVDLLTTGVDIPDLEFIVFLRPVKSRILFTQMLGRGTRRSENFGKDHFTVFDCFDGTLLRYFKDSTDMTEDEPAPPSKTVNEIVEDIWANRDRDYHIGCLVKRLQRIDKAMAPEARASFAAFLPDGDVGRYARELRGALKRDFVKEMKVLRNKDFQGLLVNYARADRTFLVAPEQDDTVSSELFLTDIEGNTYKPADYLKLFSTWVKENEARVDAIRVILKKPKGWSATALRELRKKLAATKLRFTEENLRKVHELTFKKSLVDIISMVKHAAKEDSPLLTAQQRVERALMKVTAGGKFTAAEQAWLGRIREVMVANLSIDKEDFEYQGALEGAGGWGAAKKTFGEKKLDSLLHRLNEEMAA